jgi:branched-chain amino acid transport system permease protein
MEYFFQILLVGLLSGAVLSLVGVGFTLVLGVGKIANFAHGAFVGLGMYFAYWGQQTFGISPYWMLVPGIVVFTIVGIGIAELFEWRGRKIGELGVLLVGLALLLFIEGALSVTFGADVVTVNGADLGSVRLFGLSISWQEILAAVFTLLVAAGTYVFVKLTRWGRALRAVAENPTAAGLYGIRVPIAQRAAVTASITLAGVTGIMISPFSLLTPNVGSAFLISAFAVVIIGGIGNTVGAVIAGLGIGVINAMSAGYLSSVWVGLVPLLIILGVLLARPNAAHA